MPRVVFRPFRSWWPAIKLIAGLLAVTSLPIVCVLSVPVYRCFPPCKVAWQEAHAAQVALSWFEMDHEGDVPRNFSQLVQGKYVDKDVDPWHQPFRVEYAGEAREFIVRSNGPDREPHTADDITGDMEIDEACHYR